MKNIFIKSLTISLILITSLANVSAQESSTLQFMKGVPQSNLLNPALHNDSSAVIIGLPGLSGMYFDANSDFAVNDLFHKGTGIRADSLITDITRFHSVLKNTNAVEQNFSLPIIYLGFRVKKSFFSFGITEKEIAQFTFDKSFVTFIMDGNAPYIGQNFDLGNLSINAIHYREYAFGYSNELIKNKLKIGVKVKALYGKSAIQTERMNLKVETAADASYLNLRSDMKINMSMPVTVEYDSISQFSGMNGDNVKPKDYMLQTGNTGMAFDFGVVYKLTPKILLSGSIVDMGKISFKKDINNLTHISTYKWEGIDFSKSIDNSKPDYVDPSDLADAEMKKVEKSFKPKKSEFDSKPFDVSIPTKIYLGGTYAVNDKFSIGLIDRLYKNGSVSKNSVTLSGNAMLGNIFSLTGSYSMIGDSYNNVGVGMAVRLGFMQLYIAGDNVLAMKPATANYDNARFGINFLFGRNRHPKVAIKQEVELQQVPEVVPDVIPEVTPEVDPVVVPEQKKE